MKEEIERQLDAMAEGADQFVGREELGARLEAALREAAVQGTLERVRPILMTSFTTIFGLLPLVLFSESADSNIWNALGLSLIGGLASSTLLVLTVTPALYLLVERGLEKRRAAVGEPVAVTS